MIQEEITRPLRNVSVALQEHVNHRINLVGLQLGKRMIEYTAQLINLLLLAGIFSMILLMLSFAFVFWYGRSVGPYHHGFLIVSFFYLLIGILIFINRTRIFINPLARKVGGGIYAPGESGESNLGKVETMADLLRHEEILKLQVEHSNLLIQQRMQEMGEAYQPKQLIKTLLNSALSSSEIWIKIIGVVTKIISDRKKNKQKEDES